MQPKKLIRKVVPKSGVKALENAYRKGRGAFWQIKYGFPAKGMQVVAVTGTNGKSTTSAYINEVLKAAGYRTAMMTTPMMEIAGELRPRTTTRTLEKQSDVQDFFAKAKKADVDWVVLEVPSHALDQDRIMGVRIKAAVVTNLTPEHLDYHKTMERYARAKARLITDYGASVAILNRDDKWFDFFKNSAKNIPVISVGKSKGDGQMSSTKLQPEGSSARLQLGGQKLRLETALIGEFNLYNASQAAAVAIALNLEPKTIEKGVANLKAVPGRMEPVNAGQNFNIFIDYAVTADSIENALKTLKTLTKGRVRVVFGATGDRDKLKRPAMGEVAGKHANFIYLTDDETYTEKSQDIIDAVYEGIKKAKATKKTKIIPDRGEAIKQALKDAKPGDSVYITGLGHETSRNMGGKQISWNDREVVKKALEQR